MIYDPPGQLYDIVEGTFSLVLMNPLGEPLRTITPKVGGLTGDITASVHPLTGCVGMSFTGRPDLVALEGCEVVQLFLNAGDGPSPVFYGSITEGYPSLKARTTYGYSASAEDLLDAREMDEKVYRNMDVALVALDAVQRNKHDALRVRAADFPLTTVTVDEYREGAGKPLGEVLKDLADIAAQSGVLVGGGVDPSGYVFFKPNPHVLNVDYEQDLYDELKKTVKSGVVTAVRFIYGGEPSLGSEWNGAYRPASLTYISTPDPAMWDKYRRRVGSDIPASAWVPVPGASYVQSGFSNPDNPVLAVNTTPAVRAASGAAYYQINNPGDPYVFGMRLTYRCSDDITAKVRATAVHATGTGPYWEAELPKSDGEDKTVDIKLPPGAATTAVGAFQRFGAFRLTVPTGTSFQILTAHFLRIDTDKLDAVARGMMVLPARRPSQMTPRRKSPVGPVPYVIPVVSQVQVWNSPYGVQYGNVAMIRYGYRGEQRRVSSMIDLEEASGDDQALFRQEITDMVNRKLTQKKVADANIRPLR